jgi:hypothetical protein
MRWAPVLVTALFLSVEVLFVRFSGTDRMRAIGCTRFLVVLLGGNRVEADAVDVWCMRVEE